MSDDRKSDPFDSIVARLRQEFLEEAQDRLVEIEEAIGEEHAGQISGEEAIITIRRQAHNLKGMGASFQFPIVSMIAHRLEDYVSHIKDLADRHFTDIGQFVDAMRGVLEGNGAGLSASQAEHARILRSLPAKWTHEVIAGAKTDIEFLCVHTSKVPLRLVERELVNCGYRVVTSTSPIEAFELGVRTKPDMIISAMVMNDLSGLDLARALGAMEVTKDIPFCLLTSLAPDSHQLQNLPGNTAIIRAGEFFQDDLAAAITRFGIA